MKRNIGGPERGDGRVRYVYCSGPLFCPGERGEMQALASRLEERGFGTFLPQRDGIEALVMGLVNSPLNVNALGVRKAVDRAIFALDVFQILERCDALVFNMNGRVPDEGALVETALAWTAGKPLVIYKDDARTAFKGMDNSMINGLLRSGKVGSLEEVPGEVEKALAKHPPEGDDALRREMPSEVEKAKRLGRTIWRLMERRGASRKRPDSLVAEIAKLCAR